MEALWCVHHGIPFGAAFGMTEAEMQAFRLDPDMRSAFSIVFSEFEGNEFCWQSWSFKSKNDH